MQEESFGLHRSCRSIFARGDRFRPGRKMQKIFQTKTCNFRPGRPGFAWSEKEGCSLEHFRPGRQIFARAKDHLLGLQCHFRPGREFSPGQKFRALVFLNTWESQARGSPLSCSSPLCTATLLLLGFLAQICIFHRLLAFNCRGKSFLALFCTFEPINLCFCDQLCLRNLCPCWF